MADSATTWNDGIKTLGDQIVNLSLLQAKELSDYLKEEHGLEAAAGCFCLGFSTIPGALIKNTFVLRVVERWSRIKQLFQLN